MTSIRPSTMIEVLSPPIQPASVQPASLFLTRVTASIHHSTSNSITPSGAGSSSVGKVVPMPSDVPPSDSSKKVKKFRGACFTRYTETTYYIPKLTYPQQGVYSGEMRYGFPHGKGKFTYDDGRVYQGNLLHGKFEGEGTITYPDGRVLAGIFTNGRMDKKNAKITFLNHKVSEEGPSRNYKVPDERKVAHPDSVSHHQGTLREGQIHCCIIQ